MTLHEKIKELEKQAREELRVSGPYPEAAFLVSTIDSLKLAHDLAFKAYCCGLRVTPVYDAAK